MIGFQAISKMTQGKISVLMKFTERKYIYTYTKHESFGARTFHHLKYSLSTKIITVIININQINVIM